MLNFYDFEVFKEDWLVVVINPFDRTSKTIVNDPDALEALYQERKKQIWVGYNNAHYDQWIFKAILCGFDPKEVNDWIIVKGEKGWAFSSLLRKVQMINYDVFHPKVDRGLKTHEAYMGNDIRETSVPFDIDRKLTDEELEEVASYCRHDVEQTMEVFAHRKSEFDARMGLLKMFDLPLVYLGKTNAQLTALILGAKQPKRPRDDEFDLQLFNRLDLGKYQFVKDWYLNPENWNYGKHLEFEIEGCPHKCAWGGLHGALPKYSGKGYYINMDVESYYPAEMIEYGLLSRNVSDPSKFRGIRDQRVVFKHAKDDRHKPLKLVINGTFGASKDKYNGLYDPRQANSVCVNGQLMLIDLMEKLTTKVGAIIVQSNTDGVLVRMPEGFPGGEDSFFDAVDAVAGEWEDRTGMALEFDEYVEVFQKDVNNYVVVDASGKCKRKGAYVKELDALDYDMAVVNRAMVAYMVEGVPVERTIMECDDLKDFMRVVKVSGNYKYGMHGDKVLNDRTFRVFASKDERDGKIGRVKRGKDRPDKFGCTSDHVFIDNGNVNGKKCPAKLDRRWYIDLTHERLRQYGVR